MFDDARVAATQVHGPQPDQCATECGDGLNVGWGYANNEQCDDNNTDGGAAWGPDLVNNGDFPNGELYTTTDGCDF